MFVHVCACLCMLLEAKEWLKAKGLPAESKTLHSRRRIGQAAEVEEVLSDHQELLLGYKYLIIIENKKV